MSPWFPGSPVPPPELHLPVSSWYMDTGATTHMASDTGLLSTIFNTSIHLSEHVIVGNRTKVPISSHGAASLPNTSFSLSSICIAPSIVKNLVSVRQFTSTNNCSVEFDPYGFSVMDLQTNHVTLRCNSSGDLYPFTQSTSIPHVFSASARSAPSRLLWHQRLGHPGEPALSILVSRNLISHNGLDVSRSLCNSCQLDSHSRLSFRDSSTMSYFPALTYGPLMFLVLRVLSFTLFY